VGDVEVPGYEEVTTESASTSKFSPFRGFTVNFMLMPEIVQPLP